MSSSGSGRLPDRHYRWVVVAYSLIIQAVCIGTLVYCFALFSLPWLEEFGASNRDVMLTITLLQVGMGLLGPFVGRWLDVYPIKRLILIGVGLLGIGLWLVQRVDALWQIWLLYGTLLPLATSLMGTLASQTLVTRWFDEQRGFALGLSAVGTNLGGMVLPLVAAYWMSLWGWRDAILYLGVSAVLVVVPLTLLVLGRAAPTRHERAPSGDSAGGNVGPILSTRQILTTSLFWLPFLSMIPLNMSFGAMQFNLAVFARDVGVGEGTTALLITISSFCMILGKLFFGSLGDRLDHRKLYWIASVTMMIALILMMVAEKQATLFLGVVCMGLAGGGILPLMGIIFSARFGVASFGRVMGFVMLTLMVGALSPMIAGWVYDAFGSYAPALLGLLFLNVPAFVAMFWLPKPHANG